MTNSKHLEKQHISHTSKTHNHSLLKSFGMTERTYNSKTKSYSFIKMIIERLTINKQTLIKLHSKFHTFTKVEAFYL